ncbi:hepatocyte nuclear factor 1-alpha isoform X2 [Lingula anatina]|uniref:Hepatocyte nuclear factor 1-alpha isoform X2 n=1 Tax=Lingula anatina TaxID=7574 RepID=A0A1S3HEU5_LINAN|nr:hepatocyte nuclear factor 1-alpha isoform X2 [Lingula anatina]|eukprot:XP_013384031.1 hepatocyte nuclear factor 1-alpha isoform X2 [Lingula anatina]
MVSQLTPLQKELILALLKSGLEKNDLIEAVGTLAPEKEDKKHNHHYNESATTPTSLADEDGKGYTPPLTIKQDSDYYPNLSAKPGSLTEKLLRGDSWKAARQIRDYMHQHNIPQREVVDATGLNQSHLSQHLNKGTPMKADKRLALYQWFEDKKKEITSKFQCVSNHEEQDAEYYACSPSKKSKRNRFKWGPASLEILQQAYCRNRNPTKDEREELVAECNKAECIQRGVEPTQSAGLGDNLVTEVRVYNWFANRRKEEAFKYKMHSQNIEPSYQEVHAKAQDPADASYMEPHHTGSMTEMLESSDIESSDFNMPANTHINTGYQRQDALGHATPGGASSLVSSGKPQSQGSSKLQNMGAVDTIISSHSPHQSHGLTRSTPVQGQGQNQGQEQGQDLPEYNQGQMYQGLGVFSTALVTFNQFPSVYQQNPQYHMMQQSGQTSWNKYQDSQFTTFDGYPTESEGQNHPPISNYNRQLASTRTDVSH